MRYWIYAHDVEGELVEDFSAEAPTVDAAILLAADYIHRIEVTPWLGYDTTVRIVDNEDQAKSVWIAGPVRRFGEVGQVHAPWPEVKS